ncbi:MAG TPA: peptidoglycan binding domain-containing protein [Roseiflexaceae bacterium]|nr:peptidoglycan binding domain-containing protein [Roseiflexaceae bacterium]
MSERYYQKYGPINRRRSQGDLEEGPPPEREPPRPPRAPQRAQRRRSLWRPLLGALVFGAALLTLPYLANLFAGAQAMQGVSVQGRAVGGMDRVAIAALLDERYGDFRRAPITITYEGRSWTPTLSQLGVQLDLERTADDAVAALHRGGPVERAGRLWSLWQNGLDVAPRLTVNMAKLQTYLAGLADEVEQPPRDAALSIAAGKVIPTAARPGRQILTDQTAQEIVAALQRLEPQNVVLRTRLLAPTLDNEGIAGAVKDAQAMLGGGLTLRQGERAWVWEPDKLADLLEVRAVDGLMRVSVDRERLARAVERLAQTADSPSAEPRVAFRRNRLTITSPGQEGVRIDQPQAIEAISNTLRITDPLSREVSLPFETISPEVTERTLATLGIKELVGEGTSSFAGSAAYRITNIKAGAVRMDGVLIPPGAEFSFNTQLGAVDEANGFVQGYAVIGNRTQLEWGGGVCQDSTTVFRAAFWAGLPITERHAHPFYISWYDDYSFPGGQDGPGMDATIATGALDLKFLNDTGNWLLMEATVDEVSQVMTVRLYGTKPDRTVQLRGPDLLKVTPAPSEPVTINDPTLPAGTVKQTDTARRGMEIAVYRIVSDSGVPREPELFYTRFKAWPDVYVRGTGQ